MKSFVLNLGVRNVLVQFSDEVLDHKNDEQWGIAQHADSIIRVDNKLEAELGTKVLWHEVMNFMDEDLLGNELGNKKPEDPDDKHALLDQISGAVHMALRLNWKRWRTIYDALDKHSKKQARKA